MELDPLILKISANVAGLDAGLAKAQAKIKAFNDKYGTGLDTTAQKLRTFGYLSMATLTVPLVAAGKAVTKLANDYQASMQKIVGLVGVAQTQVNAWSKEVLAMAPKVGRGPKELADALYFITSAGVRGAEAMDILRQSAMAAAAGLGETKKVADLVVSVLAAYKGAGLTAAGVTDTLVAAVREGKAEADAFANTLGSVLPLASEIGMSFDQVAAATAAMTITGSSAAQAATYLRGVLNGLYKENQNGAAALASMKTSYKELRDILGNQGMIPLLKKLRELQASYGETLASKVFPNIRALTLILDMAGKNFEYNIGLQDRVTKSAGSMAHGFQTAAETMKWKFAATMSEAQTAMIKIGDVVSAWVLPIFETLSKMLGKMGEKWSEAGKVGKVFSMTLLSILVVMGPLAMMTSTVMYIFTTFNRVIRWVQIAFITLSRTIQLTYLKTIELAKIATILFTKGLKAAKIELAATKITFMSMLGPIAIAAVAIASLISLFTRLINKKKELDNVSSTKSTLAESFEDIDRRAREMFASQTTMAGTLAGILTTEGTPTGVREEALKKLNGLMQEHIGYSLTLESSTQEINEAYAKYVDLMKIAVDLGAKEEKGILLAEQMEAAKTELKKLEKAYVDATVKKEQLIAAGYDPFKDPKSGAEMTALNKVIAETSAKMLEQKVIIASSESDWAALGKELQEAVLGYLAVKKAIGSDVPEGYLATLRKELIGLEENLEKLPWSEDYDVKAAAYVKDIAEVQKKIDDILGKSNKSAESIRKEMLQRALKYIEAQKTIQEASVEITLSNEEMKADALFKIEMDSQNAIIQAKIKAGEDSEEIALLQAQKELAIAKEVSRKKKAEAEKWKKYMEDTYSMERIAAENHAHMTIFDRDELSRALENIAIEEEQKLIWAAEAAGTYDLERQAKLDQKKLLNSDEYYEKMYAAAKEYAEKMATEEGQIADLTKQYARGEMDYATFLSRKRDITISFYDFSKHSALENLQFLRGLSLRQLRDYQNMLWAKYEAAEDEAEKTKRLEEIHAVEAEERLKRREERMQSVAEVAEQAFTQFAQNTLSAIGEGIGNLAAGTASMEDVFNNILGLVADFLIDLGKAIIATAVLTEAFKELIVSNPAAAIAAGIAAIAIGTYIKGKLSKGPFEGSSVQVASYAEGGHVRKPTLAFVGDAKDGKGEWILNFKQMQELITKGNIPSFAAGAKVGGMQMTPQFASTGSYSNVGNSTNAFRLLNGLQSMLNTKQDMTLTAVVSGKDLKFVLDQEYRFLGRT